MVDSTPALAQDAGMSDTELQDAIKAAERTLGAQIDAALSAEAKGAGSAQSAPSSAAPGPSAFLATSGDEAFAPAPTGPQLARCYGLVALGTQESQYGVGKKILLLWEILGPKKVNGEPFIITRTYTISLHRKAALRAVVDSWRGTPLTEDEAAAYDLRKLKGQLATLQVSHKVSAAGRTYANIAGVFPPPAGASAAGAVCQDIEYDADSEELAVYEKLPPWVQKMCDDRIR